MPSNRPLDAIDRNILAIVQIDADIPIAEIAHRVGLSQTPTWNRLRRLEELGFIKRWIALLDQAKLGFNSTVFVSVELRDHSVDKQEQFVAGITSMPEVMDVFRMAGDIDYMLRIFVKSTSAFEKVNRRLVAMAAHKSIKLHHSVQELKAETALPLPQVFSRRPLSKK